MELKVAHITKAYGATTILSDVSFSLERGQKVGLVGNNGTGKSTLFRILTGAVTPDSGDVTVRKGVVIGYMPQDTSLISGESVHDYLYRVSGMGELEQKLEHSAEALAEYERRNGYAFAHRVDMMLVGFGLKDVSGDRPISSLSSGQRSKVFMAGVLLADPDILLLDEPTNNLDLPALIWLEDFLARSELSCIVVSHDRCFLDRVVQKIFEINWHTRTLTVAGGTYTDYLARAQKERARQRAEHEAQQEEIQRLTESARSKKLDAAQGARFRGTDNDKFARGFKRDRAARSGKVAKAIEKRIGQIDLIEKPVERDAFRIHLRPTKPDGSREMVLYEVVAGYDRGFQVGPVSATITYGGRVVIMGLNGSGKSTLLRTLSGELKPLSGSIAVGRALVVGNFMQEHDNLPRAESLKGFLVRRTGGLVQDAYALAAKFGFSAAEMDKEIGALSPGGRARLLFALFSALSANVLLLDEPTNHLDLEALDALEEAVAHYEGTIVLVSHDRSFLKKFRSDDVYLISEGKVAKVEDLKAYMANAERAAKRLARMV
jgi:ATPase subunit of ABC transporter with duplicated ATPase domains